MKRSNFPGIAVVDTFVNLMLVFAVLLKLSLLVINIQAGQHPDRVKNSNLFLVKMQWTSADDLDLYMQDPVKHIVYFKRMFDGMMVLDHDDTGSASNKIKLPDGREVSSAFDEENITIKGIIPGEYTVNVHAYSKIQDEPTKAIVTLYKIAADQDVQVYQTVLTVSTKGEEQTAFRFTMLQDGNIVDINNLKKNFVGQAKTAAQTEQ